MRSFSHLAVLAFANGILETTAVPNAQKDSASPPIGSKENFEPNPKVGGGGSNFKDSAHFRIFGAPAGKVDAALQMMESSYDCFVNKMEWKTSGISAKATSESGTKYKENIYGVASLGNAAGQMFTDARTGYSYVKVISRSIADPTVTVHEYGHALTYHEKYWTDMQKTGVWWEPVANWFSDTFTNSDLCAESRKKYGQTDGNMRLSLEAVPKLINGAHQTIVDGTTGSGNYYQSWPFMSYMTNNPDKIPGLGKTVLRDMIRKYKKGSNETPLHGLANVIAPLKVSTVVGKYWARMAFMDIGHKQMKKVFDQQKAKLKFTTLESAGTGSFKVPTNRAPKYMGANLIPLKTSGGTISINVKAQSGFTAILGVKNGAKVAYTVLAGGKGDVETPAGSEVMLVVANTPAELLIYDGFKVSTGPVSQGLQYTVTMKGATA